MTPRDRPEPAPLSLQIKDITIDCVDIDAVATFWSRLLDRPIVARSGPYIWLERRDGIGLSFQSVARTTPGSGNVHLDVGAQDPVAEQARIEALGGRRLDGYDDGGFLVMGDPEGNRFCLVPVEPFDVDDQGRASYLARPEDVVSGG